ncbi:hypothetical protein [Methylobacterium aerolatum]|uniref:Divalent metal cation (Fe/Co/Zn/Cd) transporter n=1 Tax=Methylobacterium aerolatum TaxID=418708 RepID=A0ABU0I0Q3_9HYPH|nr:hypothetical protein [Methylobacterium aerolatum]MDQ0448171.1 divalent metal cation (Fe/Co/Zn/Cd) transporter [Methylobacterium aerolatum]GJD33963.1 hypothetical protein FMGBMHLM_0858 [Methylobacterium aerolatum]
MMFGMLVSAVLAAVGLLVGLGRIGHPIDAQAIMPYGWGLLMVGAALFVLFAFKRYLRIREGHSA